MTTFTIDTNDKTIIEQAKKFFINQLHIQVEVKEKEIEKQNKWAKIANEMKGKMSSETAQYLEQCSKEFRSDFSLREYK